MNFIVGIIMAVRSLTFMASFVSTDSTAVHFVEPQFILSRQEVKIKIGLKNALSGELLKLASTGTIIPIYVYIDLIHDGDDHLVNRTIMETRLYHDLSRRCYGIVKNSGRDTLYRSTLDSAAEAACMNETFHAFQSGIVNPDEYYYVNIYAILGKTVVEALGNNNMDLMYYWNFKRPSIRTETFKGENFIIKRN